MIDYLLARMRDSGSVLPVVVSIRGAGGDTGAIAALDKHGIIFVDDKKTASAIPWSSILRLKLLDE